jgi:hypothetical protein
MPASTAELRAVSRAREGAHGAVSGAAQGEGPPTRRRAAPAHVHRARQRVGRAWRPEVTLLPKVGARKRYCVRGEDEFHPIVGQPLGVAAHSS